eukprot:9085388-Pyramimonas_sp.AAC.1
MSQISRTRWLGAGPLSRACVVGCAMQPFGCLRSVLCCPVHAACEGSFEARARRGPAPGVRPQQFDAQPVASGSSRRRAPSRMH